MCIRFEEGLNEDIKLLVGILELKEFVVLVDRAHKAEELSKEKRNVDFDARDSRKRSTGMSYQSSSKRPKEYHNLSTVSVGYSSRDRGNRRSSSKPQATSVASVGSVRDNRPECKHYNRAHYGECKLKNGACFKCSSFEHYLRDCPEKSEKEKVQTMRPSNTAARSRPPRNLENVSNSRGGTKDSTVRFEARAPAMAYTIRVLEEASALDVITGTFSIFDTDVTTLIDAGSTHLYVCTNLHEAHNGSFSVHLRSNKMYGDLKQMY
ncbi:uncharacterized protein LOC105795925 [Gossypium raimondii]|uniref:uncharacterized protein LOC105795925 n=1 Tax=Gossypium raimondii TaxID=29730 RepID=UPI00063A9518|nr:uncharacterized protein LOC105795925 [Gossypium raimondii]